MAPPTDILACRTLNRFHRSRPPWAERAKSKRLLKVTPPYSSHPPPTRRGIDDVDGHYDASLKLRNERTDTRPCVLAPRVDCSPHEAIAPQISHLRTDA